MFVDNFQLHILWTASDETLTNKTDKWLWVVLIFYTQF
jgi:hypothetical protein